MSLLTALGMYMGGQAKAKRQHYQDVQSAQYQQSQEADRQAQEADRQAQIAETANYDRQSLAATAADRALRAKTAAATNRASGLDADGNPLPLPGYAAPSPLPIGEKGSPASPEQMVRYYSEQARIASDNYAKTGDARWAELAKAANTQAGTFASATLNTTRGTEITTGKIPLEQAQAAYWKDKPAEFRQQLASVEKRAQAALGPRYAAIASTAANVAANIRSRADLAKLGVDARESVALMTQMGILNGRNQSEAFSEAMQQQRLGQQRATATWQAQTKAIAAGGAAPAGYDPSGPPTVNLTMPSINTNPGVTNVTVVLPNGQKVTVPTVGNNNDRKPPTAKPKTAAEQVSEARKHTNPQTGKPYTDDEIRANLKKANYSDADINAALPPQHHNLLGIPLPF